MSFLRAMTLISFRNHHKDWDITLITINSDLNKLQQLSKDKDFCEPQTNILSELFRESEFDNLCLCKDANINIVDFDQESAVWALETAGASRLGRIGLRPDTVEVGDIISVRCHQLRDGSNGCLLGFLTPETGEEKEWD